MNGYRIIWPRPGVAEIEKFSLAKPNSGEVLLQTEYTVVSAGTEKAWLTGEPNTSGKFPQYPGYSASARVIELGPGVNDFNVGDRVVAYHSPHSTCSIKNINDLVKIEDDCIKSEEAAFTIIAAMSLHGVRKVNLELGESAMIVGQGLLGLFAASLARIDGANPVVALDLCEDRRQLALKMGADYAMDPTESSFMDDLKELTGGKGINAVIEVTGSPAAMQLSLECVARMGRIAALGCTRNKMDGIDFYQNVHHPGVSIIGAHNMARPRHDTSPGHWTMRDDLRVLLKLIAAGRLDVSPVISQIVSPQQATEVYNKLVNQKNPPIGVVFDWNNY